MRPAIRSWVEENVVGHFTPKTDVLEIGSYNVNGGVADFFSGMNYEGLDSQDGPGVTVVWDAEKLPDLYLPAQFDLILCLDTLEHVAHFWEVLNGILYTMKMGGTSVIAVPGFGFPEHRYPKDYWRFGPDSIDVLFPTEFWAPSAACRLEDGGFIMKATKI